MGGLKDGVSYVKRRDGGDRGGDGAADDTRVRAPDRAAHRPLTGVHVLCLRPAPDNRALAARLRREGASVRHIAPWRIEWPEGAEQVVRLRAALGSEQCIFTSPNAVRAAANLADLADMRARAWSLGAGTAAELRRRGVRGVGHPERRANSEGLLELPVWRQAPATVGLVTAPGGRDLIEPGLRARGWQVRRVEVYRRRAVAVDGALRTRVRATPPPRVLVLTSAEAWRNLRDAFGGSLGGWSVLVSSERLADLARSEGAPSVVRADDATPASLHHGLRRHALRTGFR